MTGLRVLYVEGDAIDADLARRWLAQHAPQMRVDVVETLAEALMRLTMATPPPYDIVLTDLHLRDGHGLQLVADIRAKALPVAVVVITGAGTEDTAVTALQSGADDYVVKRRDYLERLPLTLESAVHRHGAERARRDRPLAVLYAEHSVADAELTRRHFARHAAHLRVDVVGSGPAVLERLAVAWPARYDVVLLDYRLPELNGLDVLKALSPEAGVTMPVILVTGQGDEEIALQALKLGAAGYVIKTPGYLHRLATEIELAHARADLARDQAATRESQRRPARTEEHSLVMVAHIGLDGRWLKVPRRLCEILGRTEEELLARTIRDAIHPEDFETAWIQCQRLIGGDARSFAVEQRLVRSDGAVVWCDNHTAVVADTRGRPLHFLAYLTDISDRREAEAALRASEARDSSDLLVPPARFLGRSMREVLPPDLVEALLRNFARTAVSAEPQILEYAVRIDGELRHFESRMVRTGDGNVLTVIRNVTERVRAAESLHESHRRGADLASRLIASQEEERARLARELHDDLSQQMAALLLGLTLLRRHLASGNEATVGEEIKRIESHGREIAEQMRRMAYELHPAMLQQLGLAAALRSLCDDVSHRSGLDLQVELDSDLGALPLATELCFYRVVQEGLRNVVRHSGARSVAVRLARIPDGLELSVTDNGVGFDPGTCEGLGLVSLEERVRLCGGSLEIDARPGAGTRLRVRLSLPR